MLADALPQGSSYLQWLQLLLFLSILSLDRGNDLLVSTVQAVHIAYLFVIQVLVAEGSSCLWQN